MPVHAWHIQEQIAHRDCSVIVNTTRWDQTAQNVHQDSMTDHGGELQATRQMNAWVSMKFGIATVGGGGVIRDEGAQIT